MRGFHIFHQLDQMDCGPTCLRMIARYHGRLLNAELVRDRCSLSSQGVSFAGIAEAAETFGMKTAGVRVSFETLQQQVPLPCIAHWRQRHFVVVFKVSKTHVHVADPGFGKIRYTHEEFCKGWLNGEVDREREGTLLLIEPTPAFFEDQQDTSVQPKPGIWFLSPYLRPYSKLVVQIFVGLGVGTLILVSFPFITQSLVDRGINYQDLNFVYLLLAAQLMLFFSQTSVDMLRSWILLHVGSRINISLISDFLIKLMKLPISYFDSKTIGDLLQRVQDHDRIEAFLSSATLSILFSAVNVVIFSLILGFFFLPIFVVFSLGTGIYVAWVLVFMGRRKQLDYKRFDQASGNQSSMVQLLNGMQEIKLNNSERRRRWEWEQIQVKLFKISVNSLALLQYQTAGGNFVNELKNILITFIAAKAVLDGQMTLGTMLAIQYIIGQLNGPINNFVVFMQSLQDAQISLDRLAEIHGQGEELETGVDCLPESREIGLRDGVSFRYGNRHSPLVLEGIELQIPAGKVTAIVGASGSGKTTLLKLLLKFYKPQRGRITVGGVNLEDVSTRLWRQQCGVVMQDGYIFADTLLRNLTESDSDARTDYGRLRQALRIANLEELVETLPEGLSTRVGSSGIALSGGQRQRVLIARAVYKNPEYLLFDEATSALDAKNERVVMQNLAEFFEGRTVVVIAHRLSTVKNADQILTLDKGRLIESGEHQELIRRQGAYFSLIKNQLELG